VCKCVCVGSVCVVCAWEGVCVWCVVCVCEEGGVRWKGMCVCVGGDCEPSGYRQEWQSSGKNW